jgi:hypothetical protein
MQSLENRTLIELLIYRLERISADSYWAHRASGVRGSLLKILEKMDNDSPLSTNEIAQITNLGFYIIEQAILRK